ncbi:MULTISPECIES: ABC transporter substrate-binding protein [unclassified Halomonas]|uniref:ABC transporter substrate-binding protein n=1 Tax=unclassified Halomonas TaxID=2609666 RepID=UPI00209D3AF3|nr:MULTISPECIES: ABC transporter substrate-binding protein [unclassified Halomonas]MCP1315584.1 ABC transporter substrate-binding protein [Halomonas sp. 707D7]MCP1325187.1 ABC transporter substrate-binding protein [Halomonas sp. 707D4]
MALLKRCLIGLLGLWLTASASANTPSDQLIIALKMSNILSLDPAAATGNDIAFVNANLYDTLIELDVADPTVIHPALATDWEVADDSMAITFTLRDDVEFHSGNPLTAADVVWSIERVLDLNLALATTWKALGFTRENVAQLVTQTGEHELEIAFPRQLDPKLVMYTLATSPSAFILDQQEVMAHEHEGDWGNRWLTTNAAGSGAFVLGQWIPQDRIVMAKNDRYWGETPVIERVVMRNLKESQTMRLMIERGDLDVAIGMSVPDIRSLENAEQLEIQTTQRGTLYYVAVSMNNDILADERVRRAIRGTINYAGINDSIMPYYGIFHQRPVKLGLPATLPEPMYSLTTEEARALMAEAGYPNGFTTTIRALNESPFINVAINLQSSLERIGINAEILSGTGNQVYGAMRDRRFDIIVGRGGGGFAPHPDSNLTPLLLNPDNSDEARLTNFQGWRTGYQNTRINELITEAVAEADSDVQNALYAEVQSIYEEDVGALFPFSQMINTVVVGGQVEGYRDDPSAMTRLRSVTKTRE